MAAAKKKASIVKLDSKPRFTWANSKEPDVVCENTWPTEKEATQEAEAEGLEDVIVYRLVRVGQYQYNGFQRVGD